MQRKSHRKENGTLNGNRGSRVQGIQKMGGEIPVRRTLYNPKQKGPPPINTHLCVEGDVCADGRFCAR